MRKKIVFLIMSAFLTMSLVAQDHGEISVKITRDGKVVTDTTYNFNSAEEAEHIAEMAEMAGNGKFHAFKMARDKGHQKTMEFHSEDGKIHEIKGNDIVWIEDQEEGDGEEVKVIRVKRDSDEQHAVQEFTNSDDTEVIVNEDDGTIEIIIQKTDKDSDGTIKKEIHKEIIILDDASESIQSHTSSGQTREEIITIDEDGKKVVREIKSGKDNVMILEEEEGSGENVEVIVIRKKKIDKENPGEVSKQGDLKKEGKKSRKKKEKQE